MESGPEGDIPDKTLALTHEDHRSILEIAVMFGLIHGPAEQQARLEEMNEALHARRDLRISQAQALLRILPEVDLRNPREQEIVDNAQDLLRRYLIVEAPQRHAS